MILTLISPSGERWTLDPVPKNGRALAEWLEGTQIDSVRTAKLMTMILSQPKPPPPGAAYLAHTGSGWQAILSNL